MIWHKACQVDERSFILCSGYTEFKMDQSSHPINLSTWLCAAVNAKVGCYLHQKIGHYIFWAGQFKYITLTEQFNKSLTENPWSAIIKFGLKLNPFQ